MSRSLFKHHQETIERVVQQLSATDAVLAVIVGGSVAHGFATESSDVDIMIVVSSEEYESRKRTGRLTYFNNQICTYEGGYVDGKYITIDFMKLVAEKGSEPARFAFKDAFMALSRADGLKQLLAAPRSRTFEDWAIAECKGGELGARGKRSCCRLGTG